MNALTREPLIEIFGMICAAWNGKVAIDQMDFFEQLI